MIELLPKYLEQVHKSDKNLNDQFQIYLLKLIQMYQQELEELYLEIIWMKLLIDLDITIM